ncbi:dTDP-4-keto-6-deoxy-D-glucose epimerase [Actinobacteria bacterium YIM 96077]|uniref:dTDP-4-keto-6-deoxy-D-glucose epimerase n=1 Tax=Phytoactinopolyspora halophila TaxID=1981511 RepID=A0A329QBC4_9ACTN|nr:dTDP-4-dehydrorhamnose 3,5-epimerase [Phytoactinopolyspora halophila]AYY12661.1 dTDP-4-keto-6-deoxy-D-glucose epimerase [Actinobacteria bacterium YIM 96077]RAW09547.1 dTDP-4-keto-6-deoxy-D-glucose epimerase [Phytoactinopolyspora halophila]
MKAEKLTVEGALVFTPTVFPDQRGLFVSPYQKHAYEQAHGGPLFPVAQTNHSRSRRGVVRGIHYTVTPPGTAKYVYCAAGEAIDIVVDIRVGSPTFGTWDSVLVNSEEFRAVYLPVGVGHAFISLVDDTVMSYMLSDSYVAENEKAISPFDAELGLPIPDDIEPIMSERDTAAAPLAEVFAAGLLPDYAQCQVIEKRISGSVD